MTDPTFPITHNRPTRRVQGMGLKILYTRPGEDYVSRVTCHMKGNTISEYLARLHSNVILIECTRYPFIVFAQLGKCRTWIVYVQHTAIVTTVGRKITDRLTISTLLIPKK